jgi:hypothetical protein
VTRRNRFALPLTGLLFANLLLDIGLVCYGLQNAGLPGVRALFLQRATFPVISTQVFLLGSWLALGAGKWYWRLLAAIPLTICIALSESVGLAIIPSAWRRYEGTLTDAIFKYGTIHSCWFLAVLLAMFAALLPLRRLGQWRLTRQPLAEHPSPRQFSAAHVLLWLAPIGGALAITRLLVSFGMEEIGLNPVLLILNHLGIASLAVAAILTAFATRNRRRALALLMIFTLLIASGFAIAERYRLLDLMRSLPTRVPSMIARLYWGPLEVLFSYFAAMLVALLNYLVLRALGWRLIRPAWQSNTAAKTLDD